MAGGGGAIKAESAADAQLLVKCQPRATTEPSATAVPDRYNRWPAGQQGPPGCEESVRINQEDTRINHCGSK